MTPPPAATAAGRIAPTPRTADPHRRRVRRPAAPSTPRRVSYRSRPAAARTEATVSRGAVALPRLPDLRLPRPSLRPLTGLAARLAGLFRGRALIWMLAGLLLGLVFLQVSLLKLNTQISQNVERSQALERANATARSEIARLDAGRRIQDVAAQLGMVMPGAGALCYLDARRAGACTGGDPSVADTAVDPTATTAPPAPTGTDAAAGTTDPAAAATPDPASTDQPTTGQAPAPDPAAATAPAASAPAAQPDTPATPDAGGAANATGGLVAAGGAGG